MPRTISLNPFANIGGNVHFGDVQKSGKIGREIADGQRKQADIARGKKNEAQWELSTKRDAKKGEIARKLAATKKQIEAEQRSARREKRRLEIERNKRKKIIEEGNQAVALMEQHLAAEAAKREAEAAGIKKLQDDQLAAREQQESKTIRCC